MKQLTSGIPFDYREKYPDLFTATALKKQIDAMHNAKILNERGETDT